MRRRKRQILGLEDFTEADVEALRNVKPAASAAAFDHELNNKRPAQARCLRIVLAAGENKTDISHRDSLDTCSQCRLRSRSLTSFQG